MEACFLEWDDYEIPGVTYTKDLNPLYHSPFTIFRHADKQNDSVHQVCGFCNYLIVVWFGRFSTYCTFLKGNNLPLDDVYMVT